MSHKSGWDFVRFLRLLRISATAPAEEADVWDFFLSKDRLISEVVSFLNGQHFISLIGLRNKFWCLLGIIISFSLNLSISSTADLDYEYDLLVLKKC